LFSVFSIRYEQNIRNKSELTFKSPKIINFCNESYNQFEYKQKTDGFNRPVIKLIISLSLSLSLSLSVSLSLSLSLSHSPEYLLTFHESYVSGKKLLLITEV
jgi:hypothetical protein